MQNFMLVAQIILAIFMIVLVLVQTKGTGFGRSWGGGASSFTRRGLEKVVYRFTYLVSALFILVSVLQFAV